MAREATARCAIHSGQLFFCFAYCDSERAVGYFQSLQLDSARFVNASSAGTVRSSL